MKAPDKIYLDPVVAKNPENAIRYLENEIEYIRKDALVEWLQQGFDWIKNPVISVQQIIDKINSL